MFVYQRVHHVIHALEDRFPAWRSWEASPWHGTVNVKIGARVPAITGHPSVFFSMYMSPWHRVLPHHRKTEKPRNTYGIGISTWIYIYIYDIRYIIYAIHIYIYVIYIYVCCASQQGVGLLSRDFLVLLAWLSSSDSAWILRCFIWQMHVYRYYINIHTVTYVYSYNIYICSAEQKNNGNRKNTIYIYIHTYIREIRHGNTHRKMNVVVLLCETYFPNTSANLKPWDFHCRAERL